MARTWWLKVKSFLGAHLSDADVDILKGITEERLRGETRSTADLNHAQAEKNRAEAELLQTQALVLLSRELREVEGRAVISNGRFIAVRDGDVVAVRPIGIDAPSGVHTNTGAALQYVQGDLAGITQAIEPSDSSAMD